MLTYVYLQKHNCNFYMEARKSGRPHGLKGKNIGLYYAKLSKEKRRRHEMEMMPEISLDHHRERNIRKVLKFVRPTDLPHQVGDKFEKSDDYGPPSLQSIKQSINDQFNHIEESDFKIDYINNITANLLNNSDLDNDAFVERSTKLKKNSLLDKKYKDEFLSKQHSMLFKKMFEFRRQLPAFNLRSEILNSLKHNQVVVISGETGSGKTTQIPQFILDEYLGASKGSICSILCTQPRRISAISVAERVAEERDETLGSSIGYNIRIEKKLPRENGCITYCTTGVVLRKLCDDPFLSNVSHIIIDEIHERDFQVDLLMTYIKSLLPKRPDMKAILMSATLKAESFSEYFNRCPIIKIPGLVYPVEEFYLEDVLQLLRFKIDEGKQSGGHRSFKERERRKSLAKYMENFEEYLYNLNSQKKYSAHVLESLHNPAVEDINLDLMYSLIKHICINQDEGAILVFLPGWEFICNLVKLLNSDRYFTCGNHIIIPLHSIMPTIDQKEVFQTPEPGIRKIIVSTNIAETSITINDVVYVIDSGKANYKTYDGDRNLQSLTPQWISLASSKQRKGRAGRVKPGVCYHLYHRGREMLLDAFMKPEILRIPLEEVCLQIKILKLGKVYSFLERTLDPPSAGVVELALKNLYNLNAINDEEELTPLGFHLARLPLDPLTGKLVLFSAIFSCVDPITTIAAILSFKDPFISPLGKLDMVDEKRKSLSKNMKSDHLMLYFAYKGWEEAKEMGFEQDYLFENFLSRSILNMIRKIKHQLVQHLFNVKLLKSCNEKDPESNINSENLELIRAVICAGFYPQVIFASSGLSSKAATKFRTPEDGAVKLHPKSVNYSATNFSSPWLVYKLKVKSSRIFIHDSTMASPSSLLFFGKTIYYKKNEENNVGLICVDENIKFKATEKTTNLIQKLRLELDKLLAYKISHPGITCWDVSTKEGTVLSEIVKLLSDDIPNL